MLKYEFFQPAIKGLKPGDAARVTHCLEAAMIYGALEYIEARNRNSTGPRTDPTALHRRYDELISSINAGETFGR